MKIEFIKDGRFDKAIWLRGESTDFLAQYPNDKALSVGVAIQLWKGLTQALIDAGQGGLVDTDMPEFNDPVNNILKAQRRAAPAMYEALVDADNQLCSKCGKDCSPWECASHMRLMNVINKAEGEL